MFRSFMWGAGIALGLAVCGSPVVADVVTNDPTLPPTDGVYLHPGNVHTLYSGAALDIILKRPEHQAILVELRGQIPMPGPPGEREVFFSTLDGRAEVCPPGTGPTGCGNATDVNMSGPVETWVLGKGPGDTTGIWPTEMVSMNLSGNVGGNPVMIRESPTMPSLGQVSVTDIGGGNYRIDSFFDVWTELSLDGGMSWTLSSGPTHMVLVPEPASFALVALGLIGLLGLRRRSR